MNNWKAWLENLDIKPYSVLGLLILLALPVTLMLVFQSQDNRSRAADFKSVTVSTIPALKTALADNTVDEIIVTNGTYHVSVASSQRSDSLWIGAAYASRTRPITVRAETKGGVTFDGGGATYFGCITFVEGAHDQIWDGFNCASGQATETGVIVFGGYAGKAAPHHITLKNIHILSSCTAHNERNDHGVYFSWAPGGPHDILLEDFTVDGPNAGTNGPGLSSAIHFYHSDSANLNAWNVTIRRLTVNGTFQPIILWDSTIHDILIEDTTINNAAHIGVRYEDPGTNIILKNITTVNSGYYNIGFYSSQGSNPPGITFINSNFDGVIYGGTSSSPTPTATKTLTPTPTVTKIPTPTLKPTSTPTPTLKPTSYPTPTPVTNSTILRFQKIFLHGIGKGGDNTNPTSAGNNNPLRTTRTLTVELIESSGNTLPGITGNITYQGNTLGYFSGDITIPASIPAGNYLIKVKSPQYLKKQVLGIVSITKGAITTVPQISLTAGDVDNNNSLTINDFNKITECYSDLLPAKNCSDSAKKQSADLTDDGKVNQADYNLFLRELSVAAGD